jgi:negative regulator of flagellin synthesis FlgM
MKIDNSINSAGAPAPNDPAARAPASGPAAAVPPDAGSTGAVNLTALSSQMQTATASLANAPVINQSQVDEIKQAIASGQFKVNPEVVADRLLDTVRELINSKSA